MEDKEENITEDSFEIFAEGYIIPPRRSSRNNTTPHKYKEISMSIKERINPLQMMQIKELNKISTISSLKRKDRSNN